MCSLDETEEWHFRRAGWRLLGDCLREHRWRVGVGVAIGLAWISAAAAVPKPVELATSARYRQVLAGEEGAT
jgi:hypothetical protein